MNSMRDWLWGAVSVMALGCGVPNIVFDDGDSGSSGSGSSGSASPCLTGAPYSGVCCESLPSPIQCVGAACSPSLCNPSQCDQCVGQLCCARTTGMTVGIACRPDTKCPQ
jgi:hypothetical protein